MVFPTPEAGGAAEQTTVATEDAADTGEAAAVGEAGDEQDHAAAPEEAAGQGDELTAEVQTDEPEVTAAETAAPQPARGDGPNNIPRVRRQTGFNVTVKGTYLIFLTASYIDKGSCYI